jgi:hypothetical protein
MAILLTVSFVSFIIYIVLGFFFTNDQLYLSARGLGKHPDYPWGLLLLRFFFIVVTLMSGTIFVIKLAFKYL